MATIINNPSSATTPRTETNSWAGLLFMLALLFLILYLGVPYVRNMNQSQVPTGTNEASDNTTPAEVTQAPADNSVTNDTNLQIPETIDVNINQVSPEATQ